MDEEEKTSTFILLDYYSVLPFKDLPSGRTLAHLSWLIAVQINGTFPLCRPAQSTIHPSFLPGSSYRVTVVLLLHPRWRAKKRFVLTDVYYRDKKTFSYSGVYTNLMPYQARPGQPVHMCTRHAIYVSTIYIYVSLGAL